PELYLKKLRTNLFGKAKGNGRKPLFSAFRPRLETLEERANPSSGISNGDLYVYGTNGHDVVSVTYEKFGNSYYYHVKDNGASCAFSPACRWRRPRSCWGSRTPPKTATGATPRPGCTAS